MDLMSMVVVCSIYGRSMRNDIGEDLLHELQSDRGLVIYNKKNAIYDAFFYSGICIYQKKAVPL